MTSDDQANSPPPIVIHLLATAHNPVLLYQPALMLYQCSFMWIHIFDPLGEFGVIMNIQGVKCQTSAPQLLAYMAR